MMMKKMFSATPCLALFLALTLMLQTVAYATPLATPNTENENNPYLVEVITGQAAIEQLPEELLDILQNDCYGSSTTPYGLTQPSTESHRHNLGTDGRYDLYVATKTDTIFSTKVLIGHGGKVNVHLQETGLSSLGKYKFQVYSIGLLFGTIPTWDTVIYDYSFPQGTTQDLTLTCDPDALIYLAFVPNGNSLRIENNYIEKG